MINVIFKDDLQKYKKAVVAKREIWELRPPGTVRACPEMYKDCFIFTLRYIATCSFHPLSTSLSTI